jgi:type VI secretion system protein ImpL
MALLKNFIVWTGLGLLVLLAAIWFGGPVAGLTRVDLRIFAALVLIVVWVILVFLKKQQPSAQVSVPTPQVQLQTSAVTAALSADAGSSESVGAFKAQLDRAIQWLRGSKLGKTGQDVVYRLPWYLVVGPPGSGKSSLVYKSSLNFPYSDPDRSLASRGIGPTQNCDLWIANEALFIDVAGRYSLGEAEKETWLGFLDQIKRLRRDKPLDGVLLTIDVASLIRAGNDERRDLAKKLRARLDQMTQRLGMLVPVYLLFSKCDQLEGFLEFFRDLAPEEMAQVWGCTFRKEQYQSLQSHQEFQKELDLLCNVLRSRRTTRLASRAVEGRDKVYSFPLQLGLARHLLVDFVTELFQANNFRERPLFRGFYLISSVQEGVGVDLAAEYINRKVEFPATEAGTGRTQESKAHFAHRLLTQVVFPDRILAGSSATSKRRGLLVRIALGVALGVILPLLLWFVIRSYAKNQSLLASIENARTAPIQSIKAASELQILRQLRGHLEELDDCPEARSKPGFQWGMFIGDRVLEPARKLYAQRLKQSFILPSGQEVKIELRNNQSSTAQVYHLLKTYLMMTESDPVRAEDKYLLSNASPLSRYWFQGIGPEHKEEAEKQLTFYLHMLAFHKDPNYLMARTGTDDAQLIANRREFLLTFDVLGNYYNVLRASGNQKAVPMTLGRALDGKDLDLFAGTYELPGAFTRNGWETSVKSMVGTIGEEYERGSWVLARPALGIDPKRPGREAMSARLSEMYFADYAKEWSNFIRGIKIAAFKDRKDAAERLGRLTKSQDSPMLRLFKAISANTWQDLEGKDSGNVSQDGLVASFKPIHQFVAASKDQKPAITQYLEVLGRVYKELYAYVEAGEPPTQIGTIKSAVGEALGQTALLIQNFTPEANALVKPVLEQPIKMALTLTPAEDTSGAAFPTLAPLTPPSLSGGGGGSGLVIGGLVTARGESSPIDKAVLYLLKAGSREVTLNNYLTLATTGTDGRFRFPKAMPAGKYGLFVKARGFRTISQDIELNAGRSQLNIALPRE